MSKEKQIEIKVVTYKEERLNYFTALYEKAKNKFDRLFKKYKDAPYLSDEFQKMSDAGHEAEFLCDVVKMLKQSEWISVEDDTPKNQMARVLVFLRNEKAINGIGFPKIDTDRYVNGEWIRWGRLVTHWMPLPEVPKGGAE